MPFSPASDRTAIITGAASGIGAAFAAEMAGRGHPLLLIDRDAAGLDGCVPSATAPTERCVADLSTLDGREEAARRIAAASRPGLFVHCAALSDPGGFLNTPVERHRDIVAVNALATVELTHAAANAMRPSGGGGIILVSSIGGRFKGYLGATYGATKAMEDFFALTLRRRWSGTGLRIQSLCPGYVRTPLHTPEEAARIPGWLFVSPEEVVRHSLRALARNRGRCVTGWKARLLLTAARLGLLNTLLRAGRIPGRFQKRFR